MKGVTEKPIGTTIDSNFRIAALIRAEAGLILKSHWAALYKKQKPASFAISSGSVARALVANRCKLTTAGNSQTLSNELQWIWQTLPPELRLLKMGDSVPGFQMLMRSGIIEMYFR